MHYEGDFEVLEHLFKKQQLITANDSRHVNIRPVLLVLSGTMRGVYGGGQVSALENFGLNEVFDVAVGISTGAPTVAHFLAGQAHLGTTTYYEECVSPQFISLRRMWQRKSIVDTNYLCRVFRGEISHKPIDQEKVMTSRTNFFVGVTDARTGKGELLDAKKVEPDIIEAIRASIAIPGFTSGSVEISGSRYVDGVGALSFPIEMVVERFRPTDILILANRPQGYTSSKLDKYLAPFLMRKFPRSVREVFRKRHEAIALGLTYLYEKKDIRFMVLWSDEEVRAFERDPRKLIAASKRAKHHLDDLLFEASSRGPAL